jgi:hypothetical protein
LNTFLKIGIGAALVGGVLYGVKKAHEYINTFRAEVSRYGIPTINQAIVYLPIAVKFNNPTTLSVHINDIVADVFILKNNAYVQAARVNQALTIPPGVSEQVITAAINLKNILGGNILNFAANLINTKSLQIRTDVHVNYLGIPLPKQTFSNKVDLQNFSVSGLGLVSKHKRNIKSGLEYNKYFDLKKIDGKETRLKKNGSVFDTLRLMQKMADECKDETKFIAEKLKASTLNQSLNNLWTFLYSNVQYKKDNPLREQLRKPIRTWQDRATGVDCDCYSIFIATVLKNWGVNYAYRMTAYSDDYQHVYVVVPIHGKQVSNRADYIVIDPVTDRYNYEVPFSKKFDSWK